MKRKQNISTACRTKTVILCTVAGLCLMWGGMPYTERAVRAESSWENADSAEKTAADIGDSNELSGLIGENFEETRLSFGCSEPGYSMNFQYAHKGAVTLGSLVSGSTISCVRISGDGGGTQYSLCGVKPGMSAGDAKDRLEEDGYTELNPGSALADNAAVFYNSDLEYFLQIDREETEETVDSVSLTACSRGIHTDKTDVWPCYGMTVKEVMETVGDLALRAEADEVFLEKEGVAFSGPADHEDLLNSAISGIVVSGIDSDCCIYGVCPGDSQEEIEQTGFDGGGSGELIDPAGRVLTFYYSSDPESPGIILN